MQACIDEKQLLELTYGTASAELRQAAELHAATCDRCRELLETTTERITWTGDEPRTSEPVSEPLAAKETLPAVPTKQVKKTAKKPVPQDGKIDPKALVDALRTAGFPVRPTRGTSIGRYMVIDRLGEATSNAVYSAYDPDEDRKVAIRLFDESASKDARLASGLRKLVKFSHSSVVQSWEVGTEHGRVFHACEFAKGATLKDWLKDQKRSWRDIVDVFVRAGRGLEAAHAAGLVHGKFELDEVFIGKDGRVVVADVGLAKVVEKVEATPADDQYRFCAALYEALFSKAKPVPEKVTMADVARSEVSERVKKAVLRGLSPKPEDRFGSMTELLSSIEERKIPSWMAVVGPMVLIAMGMLLVFALDRCGLLK